MKLKLFITSFLTLFILYFHHCSLAQTRTIDSLLTLLKSDNNDTLQVAHLLHLCREYRKAGKHEQGLKYSNKAIMLSSSIKAGNRQGWLKGISTAYTYKGNIYLDLSNYNEALTNYSSALKIAKINGDRDGISEIYNQTGTVYYYLSNYTEALTHYSTALEISMEINKHKGIADAYNNLGNIHYVQGDYEAALKNYIATLGIAKQIGNRDMEANAYINIGNIYQSQNNSADALSNYNSALKIHRELKDKYGIANCYNNIGYVYFAKKDFPSALQNYNAAQRIAEEIENKQLIALSSVNSGNVYESQNNHTAALSSYSAAGEIYKKIENKYGLATVYINMSSVLDRSKKTAEANTYLKQALEISKEIGSKDLIKISYYALSLLDSMQGHWNDAYLHHKLFIAYRDSIDNEETHKRTLHTTMTYEFKKKEAEIKAEQEKKDAVASAERKKQQIILLLVSCVLALALVFGFFVFRTLKLTRQQKSIIEIKNKDIIDSINYAKRIQDALLKNEEHISEKLHNYFVLFKPKDIVSGDFYWSIEKEEYWYFAVADCTGHGVPGGFMSMLGIAFLNEITARTEVLSPAEILEQLRTKIVKELGQDEEASQSKDGMDISLMRLNLKTNELQWAGANTSLYFVHNKRLTVIKPDKQPIGYYLNMRFFTNHSLQIEKDTTIYLLTDGYADQFGGPKGKKFMQKNLKELFLSLQSKSVHQQKEILNTAFDSWKENYEQVDDVCIVGIKM